MPDLSLDPVATVDRCAELSALLDDPFADRAAVLRGAGLDEAAWAAVQERWVATLTGPDGEALVARYGEVYETTLRRLSSGGAPVGPPPDTDREGPAFLSKEAQPWRDEAAAVVASGTGTAPTPLRLLASSPSSFPAAAARGAGARGHGEAGRERAPCRGAPVRPPLPAPPRRWPTPSRSARACRSPSCPFDPKP